MNTRMEKDSLGERKIAQNAYFGIQTARALENFPISGWKAHPRFLEATLLIKKAAAQVHQELKLLPAPHAQAIIQACNELLEGQFADQFLVDVFQAGAGTSHHMNVNEVIANRANKILGSAKGSYSPIHPNDHVNLGQSTNDVVPTAIRLAALRELREFLPRLSSFAQAFRKKEKEFFPVMKAGRTHLQDATPLRLGEEFSGYAQCLENHRGRIEAARLELLEIGLGGTAVGTGVNSHPEYPHKVAQKLADLAQEEIRPAQNFFEAMQSLAPLTHLSSVLRNLCVDLTRIANDLRLLASGPRTGLAEIVLPAVQPGSSIMPGKVNPSMLEMLNMVCFFSMGLDQSIVLASQAGQLELNVMMPLVAYSLPWMITLVCRALVQVEERCIEGIQARGGRCRFYAENTVSIATLLNPILGYARTAQIVKEAIATDRTIREVLEEKKILTSEQINQVWKEGSK